MRLLRRASEFIPRSPAAPEGEKALKDPARLIAHEEPHGYALDGFPIPSVSAVLAGAGYTPPFDGVPGHVLRAASRRGSIFHAATLAVERNEPVEIPEDLYDDLAHRLGQFERFLGDHSLRLVQAEESGWNEELYYAGTWDRLYGVAGGPAGGWRLDIKTSAKPSAWWSIQLALYNLADGGDSCARFALWFPKGAAYQLIPARDLTHQQDVDDYADAIAAVKAYHYRVRHGLVEGVTVPKKRA